MWISVNHCNLDRCLSHNVIVDVIKREFNTSIVQFRNNLESKTTCVLVGKLQTNILCISKNQLLYYPVVNSIYPLTYDILHYIKPTYISIINLLMWIILVISDLLFLCMVRFYPPHKYKTEQWICQTVLLGHKYVL